MPCKPLYCVCGNYAFQQRYVLCIMAFLAVLVSYTMRVCLHIALTEMVVSTSKNSSDSGNSYCPDDLTHNITVKGGTHNWTEQQQGLILASFFPGYVISHVPGGLMADKYGAKHIISGGIALSGLFTLLTPLAVKYGSWWMLIIIRVLIGFAQGALYPSISTLLARWVPVQERTGLGAFVNAGNQIGSILGNLLTSFLMAAVDWQAVFYFWGLLALVWYVIFIVLCYSEPSEHPHITPEEAEMLNQEIGPPQNLPVPWKAIVTDPVNWALLAGQAGHDWIFFLIVVQLPKYMKDVLKFNVKQNGILNSLPYLCLWICSVVSGIIADYVITKEWVSILRMRQIYTFVGNVGPGAFVLLASYMGCNRIYAAVMFTVGMFVMGPFYAGMKVNVLDVTKNFAGIIMALVNGLGSLLFIPVPTIIGHVAADNSIEQWRLVFFVLFVVCLITSVLYVVFTSTERAKWDEPAGE